MDIMLMLFENSWPRFLLSENNFADDVYPFFQTSKQHDFCKKYVGENMQLLIILDAWWRYDINTLSTYVYLGGEKGGETLGDIFIASWKCAKIFVIWYAREQHIDVYIHTYIFMTEQQDYIFPSHFANKGLCIPRNWKRLHLNKYIGWSRDVKKWYKYFESFIYIW